MFSFLKKKQVDPNAALKQIIGSSALPTFPAVVMKTLEEIRNPETTPKAIERILSVDPGLTLKILKTVNSAAYSPIRKVNNLNQAIAMMGMSSLESLVLSIAVQGALKHKEAKGFKASRFWRTAAKRATVARTLAEILHPAQKSESFTQALLQDMAIPLISQHKPDHYGELLEHWHNSQDDLIKLESSEFGWSHAEVATWMCNEWELPENMASAIGGHHSADDELLKCPHAVFLVSFLKEIQDNDGIEQLIETAFGKYAVPKDKTVDILKESEDQAEEIAKLFT